MSVTSNVVPLRSEPMANPDRLVCEKCGVDAACGCGAKLVKAWKRAADLAAAAIAANPGKTDRMIADEIGVGNATVSRARKRSVSCDTLVRVGKGGKQYRNYPRIKFGASEVLSDAFRKAMKAGMLAEQLGMNKQTYSRIKRMVMLVDHHGLEPAQKRLAEQAIEIMNRDRQVEKPFQLVKSLAERVWGSNPRQSTNSAAERRRADKFNRSIGAICGACAACDHITVPYLSKEDVAATLSDLADAVKSLKTLIQAVKGARQ